MYEHFFLDKHNVVHTCANVSQAELDKMTSIKGSTCVRLANRIVLSVEDDLHIFTVVE